MTIDLDTIFVPSESFLKAIGETAEKNIVTDVHTYDSIASLKAEKRDILEYIMDSANDLIDSTFTRIEDLSMMSPQSKYDRYADKGISAVLCELMFNSYIHSPAKTGLHIKSFYGQNFGLGIFDGGSFYKQDWVKKSIESKTNIPSNVFPSELNIKGSGTNRGIRSLYKYGSFIEVDTAKGVLYLTIVREVQF